VKKIILHPNVPAVNQSAALQILKALHQYAETGQGSTKFLSGQLEGLLRLRVGNYWVLFDEDDDSITVLRISQRGDAYR
jgi:mRNA-degrading endonuclease RelE of RelBE toxin-antitoxin system